METVSINALCEQKTLGWQELYASTMAVETPFVLSLANGTVFKAEKVIRILPRKRMVVFGQWEGKPVVAKLFYCPKNALRHAEKEMAGIRILQENKVPTAALQFEGASADRRVQVLIFSRLLGAKSLAELWEQRDTLTEADLAFWQEGKEITVTLGNKSPPEIIPLLEAVTVEIATQHVLGILQKDIHFKNFLLQQSKVYTLDGGQVKKYPKLLAKKRSIKHFALFLAQLGAGMIPLQKKLFALYAHSRGWRLKENDEALLFSDIKHWQEKRWQRYEKKIFRSSSQFAAIKTWRRTGMYDKAYATVQLMEFLAQPESAMTHPEATLIKAGRSSTVVKLSINQHTFIIKRYNIKNIWHRCRRLFRFTRAETCWRLAQKLRLFNVPTAKPIAFITERFLGMRGKSYLIMEYIAGEDANHFFARQTVVDDNTQALIQKIIDLLTMLKQIHIAHGDLKLTNILLDQQQQPLLIDLDGAREYESPSSLQRAWQKEKKRLLENFSTQPALNEAFKQKLNLIN